MSKKWFDLEEQARLAKKNHGAEHQRKTQNTPAEIVCPECGTKLYHEAGCIRCYSCGWTKC